MIPMAPGAAALAEVKLAIQRKDFESARAKCEKALTDFKDRHESETAQFLLARAEINCLGHPRVTESSIQKANQDFQRARFCCDLNDAVEELIRVNKVISRAIPSVYCFKYEPNPKAKHPKIRKTDPLSLPIEVLDAILLPLDPHSKARCLRISREWRYQLSLKRNLWRSLEVLLTPKMMGCEGGAIRLFSVLSGLTLTEVEIEFDSSLDQDQILLCLKRLALSSKTLKRLSFKGKELVNFSRVPNALRLASCCLNLEVFEYLLEENLRDSGLEDSESDSNSNSEEEEDYCPPDYFENMIDTERDEKISYDLDDTNFKCAPKEINLKLSSHLVNLHFGEKAQLFKKAEKVKIEIDNSEEKKSSLSQSELLAILNSSKDTLKELVIEVIETDIYQQSKIGTDSIGSRAHPIHLPNLEVLQLPSGAWKQNTADGLIHILAPKLDWEELGHSDLVSNAGNS